MKRYLVSLIILAALLAGPPVAAQFSFLGLKNSLVQFALEQISVPGELEITAEGVEDTDEGATDIVGLAIADSEGEWLRIDRLSLRWNASRILRGELEINRLAASGVDVRRAPAPGSAEVEVKEDAAIAQTDDDPFDWPRAPISVRVDELQFQDVQIADGLIAPQSLRFDADGAFRDEGDEQSLNLSVLRTDDIAGTILVDYLRDFAAETLTLTLQAEEAAGGLTGTLAGFPPDSASRIDFSGSGPLNDWALRFDAEAEEVVAIRGTAQLNAVARLAAKADFVLVPGQSLSPAVQRALAPEARLRVDVTEDENGVVRINEGSLSSTDVTLRADGFFDRAQALADINLVLDVDGRLSDLAEGVAFAALGFDGSVTGPVGDLNARGALTLDDLRTAPVDVGSAALNVDVQISEEIKAIVDGRASALRLDRIDSTLLGEAELNIDVLYAGDTVALNQLAITARPLSLTLNGDADLAAEAVTMRYALYAPDLAPIAAAYETDAAGGVSVEGRVSGPFAAPRLDGRVDLTALEFQGESYGQVALIHDAVLDADPSGSADLSADGSRFGPVTFRGDFALAEEVLALSDLTATGLGATIDGDVSVDLATTLADGTIALTAPDLSGFSAVTGQTVRGAANGNVVINSDNGAQNASVDLAISGIEAAGVALVEGDVKAQLNDVLGALSLDAAVRFEGLVAGGAEVASGTLDAVGDLAALTLNADVARIRSGDITLARAGLNADVTDVAADDPGISANLTLTDADLGAAQLGTTTITTSGRLSALALDLDTSGTLSNEDPLVASVSLNANLKDAIGATIDKLRVRLKEDDDAVLVALRQPLRISQSQGATTISDLDLALPGGALTGDATIYGTGIAGDLALDIADLRPLAKFASVPVERGALDMTAAFDTRPARAAATVVLNAPGFRFADVVADVGAVDLRSDIAWNGRVADVTATVSGPFGDPLRIAAGLPLRAGNGPVPTLPQSGELTGSIDWRGEISRFWALVPAPGHVLAGDTLVALRLGGTVGEPDIGGNISVSNGRYENLDVGTILMNLTVDTEISGTGAFVVNLDADDGAGRPVNADVIISDGTLDARIAADGATLVRRDDATASITLDIAARGALAAPDIAGTINIDKAEIRLIAANPPGIADLGDVRIKGEERPEPPPPFGEDIDLNIDITAPQDVFVRGRGLDTEWMIDLEVRGTAAVPRIKGLIEARRGTLDFLGRLFELDPGVVRFTNSRIIDPMLDIQLLRENDGIVGGIAVSGTGRDPQINFTSQPALPEEEVLPRVLFGSSKQSLSPTEALQLAIGVATLLDGSGGGIDSVRGAIGVDVLRIDGEGADTTVTVGSNVADGVFVGAKQPIGGGSASVQVEVEVFDNVTIDSEVGPDIGTSIGLNWKKDF
ncbi:MAG: translocation/assembly module TamB domain-containing protein [Pseudomonadota bacterium]